MSTQQSVSFDRAAGFYDETRGFPPGEDKHVAHLLAQAGNLTPASRVLEVGVGTGRIALPLVSRVGTLVGVDISRRMMGVLRQKPSYYPVRLVQGSAIQLPFADNSFDAVVAVHVFHLIPGWEHALTEIKRVLKPGAPLLHGHNGPRLLTQFRVKAFAGLDRETAGVSWDDRETFLTDKGWQRRAEYRHHYRFEAVPAMLVTHIEERIWSSTWSMSDADIETAASQMRDILAEEFDNPQQPVSDENYFSVEVFDPPPD